MRYVTILLSVLVASLGIPALALAADTTPVTDQYESPVTTTTTAAAETTSTLPFTGAELSFIALAGVALLGSGVLLRRIGLESSRNQ